MHAALDAAAAKARLPENLAALVRVEAVDDAIFLPGNQNFAPVLQANKHDNMARRGLIQMVGKRKKLLKYLEAQDFAAYQAIIAKLGLRK